VSFGFVELRQESPMLDIRLFCAPTFTGAQITAFAISSGIFAQFLFLPLYLENVLGCSAVKTGVIFLPLSLLAVVVAPVSGRLSTRVPIRFPCRQRRPVIRAGDRLRRRPAYHPRPELSGHRDGANGPLGVYPRLNVILLVAAFILFAGAVLALVLVRRRDFVESRAAVVPAEAG
jgi:Major Facilitator Superfamily